MTGPVVCGVDFSDDSRRALRWAHLLARQSAQPLIVVHAVEPLLASAAQFQFGVDAVQTTLLPELEQFVARAVGGDTGARLELGVGEPAGMLRGAALAADAGVIVLGTQGLGQAGRIWFGSTTTRVLRETTHPVLAVPRGAAARSDAGPEVRDVIAGIDLGESTPAVIAAAGELGKLFGAPITALHAVPEVSAPERWNHVVAQAIEQALRAARAGMASSVPAHWSSDVRTGSASTVLVAAAAGHHAIIVVGLSGDTPGRRPGTTAYRVLCDADAPVLAVPGR